MGQLGPAGTVLVLLLAYPILRAVYNLYFHPLAKIPGPRSWAATRLPFIRALLGGTIVHDIQKLHRRYGPVLRIAPDEVTFANAEAWNDIFQPRPGCPQFLKDPTWWKPQPGVPQSLVNAIDPENHAWMRKLLTPGFTPRALRGQEPFLHRYVDLLVDRLRETVLAEAAAGKEAELDIGPWFNFAAFDIFGDLGFGESFDCLQNSRYHPWIALLFNSVKAASFVAAARYYPWIEYALKKCIPPSLRKMRRDHYQQIADKVQRRLNYELDRPDIMSHVIKQGSPAEGDRDKMSLGEMNATFMVLTTAGSETTATALSGTMNYLVQHPDALARLAREVRERFPTGPGEITLDALRDLAYLNAVLTEGLRLCTPIPWMLPRRVPPGGATVGGVWLPGNTAVSIQAYALNREARYFHRPDSFLPERWLPEASADPASPFFGDQRDALHPFSLGPRSCLGQHLAWAEMRLILAKLLWTFDFSAPQDRAKWLKWEDLRTFALVEKRPILVRMKLRAEGAALQ
ncbi:67ae26ce-880a-443c-9037-8ef0263fdfe6 [Thermothielavioides terrestris]|uniref:67ae26ce-880a-443c-9037-8ef0263fdfe6 n=1 Tax=Thermothielavioides terrestris TaxID=2587410 RepID=A0A446BX76_9PEZI|nr:67ae26ce-880a-443c-9037-8ef0263fdfe6 [Thermothielavioides terrestris]